MIDYLNNLLRHLFISQIDVISNENQVRFQPPDQDWRTYVSTLNNNALNIYLIDMRENRKLHSNERVRDIKNGIVNEIPAPRRVDCHYLITAWSPIAVTSAIEPTIDEHILLYSVIRVLINNDPLAPSRIYSPLPVNYPEELANIEFPITVLPTDGFPKLAEFWGTVGWRWKPAVYLIVTLPVSIDKHISGAMVTTRITEYRFRNNPETAELWIQIGGYVLDETVDPHVSLPGAWVQIEELDGKPLQNTITDKLGCFTFEKLKPGRYQLRWRVSTRPELAPRVVDVPSPDGDYNLRFK